MKTAARPSFLTLLALMGIGFGIWTYFNNVPSHKAPQTWYVTCFAGDEMLFAGPVTEKPVQKGGTITLSIPNSGSKIELMNGTCALLSTTD